MENPISKHPSTSTGRITVSGTPSGGAHDRGARSGRSLDLRGLLEGEEQRQFALVYVTAFLESSLKGREDYLPLFRDHRVIGGWLPKTIYVTQFQESSFRPLATFEEDIDVTSGAMPGVTLRGDSLATWRENVLPFRSRSGSSPGSTGSTQENQAVWVGWNNRIAGKDTTRMGPPAAYVLEFSDGLGEDLDLGPGTTLDFMLTALDQTPRPRKDPTAEEEKEERAEEDRPERDREEGNEGGGSGIGGFFSGIFSSLFSGRPEEKEDEEKEPLRLSVQLVDGGGRSAKVLVNRYGALRRPIEIRIARRDDQQFAGNTEMVLQTFSIPLSDFVSDSADPLDLSRLEEIRFLFDESKAGTVVLDQVGPFPDEPCLPAGVGFSLTPAQAEAMGGAPGVESLVGIVQYDRVSQEGSSKGYGGA